MLLTPTVETNQSCGHWAALLLVVALALAGFAVPVSAFHASAARACAPPRGPGDNFVHSSGLRVKGVSCATGRRVVLSCARFTYGRSGSCAAAHRKWYCTSTRPPGSESRQRCVSGSKVIRILW